MIDHQQRLAQGNRQYGSLSNATDYYRTFVDEIKDVQRRVESLRRAIETSEAADGVTSDEAKKLLSFLENL